MYKKRGVSPKIQRRIFGEIKGFGLRRCLRPPTISTTLQEVGFFPTFVYFYLKGLFGGYFKWLLCRCSKGLYGLFLDGLWPFHGRFCGMICDCLWHVQKIILRVV